MCPLVESSASDTTLDTIPKLLSRNVARIPDAPAYREKEFGIWQTWSWAETAEAVNALARGLIQVGLEEGDHVAIIGRNRPRLYMAMVAIQSAGAVPVPVYQDSVAGEMAYVLSHCSARFAIAGDQEQVDKILQSQDSLPGLEQVIYLDPRGLRKYDRSRLHEYGEVEKIGRSSGSEVSSELARRMSCQGSDDACVMLYTSGTTGRPKGVVLSNRNIIETSRNTCAFDGLSSSDSVLAYLPMAWVGDFIFSIGQAYWSGFCVACPESDATMHQDLREVGPSYFFAPPRIFEQMLTNVMIRMEDASRLKRRMFRYFMEVARQVGADLLEGHQASAGQRILYWLGALLVYGPLKNNLGLSRVRVGYTAGEAIGPEIFVFYRALGINLKQLYGQTEASVFITQQPDGEVKPDTVGIPSPGVEIRIDDAGEVHYRSPGVFVEYYRNEESTRETKRDGGWVATGDAGVLEKDTGHLRIIDRARDVGKTADGRMFAPKYVENKLKFYPNILEAVVFGAGRETCAAFINIDLAAVGNWAERNNVAYASYQDLAAHPQVYEMIQRHIEEVNDSLSRDESLAGCQISRFLILHKELDADDGELTRTRKVRRRIIEDKYGPLITALYDGSKSVFVETEVTYEDGRKGLISSTLEIRDVRQGTGGANLRRAA